MLTENKVTGMECLFFGSDHVTCKNEGELKSATITRIETIKKKSIKRGDTLHAMLNIDEGLEKLIRLINRTPQKCGYLSRCMKSMLR